MSKSFVETFYPEFRFGGFTDVDGTMAFYNRVNALAEPSYHVLDLGCGRGAHAEDPVAIRRGLRCLKGKVAKVVGLDVDPSGRENPTLDEFHLMNGDIWPLADDAFDLIMCDNVLEHVEQPDRLFAEARRVLRNGGYLCIRTPNRWGYVSLIASLIPNRLHAKVTGMAQSDRKDEDVFPTVYRCNSVRKIRRSLHAHDFNGVVYGYEAEPSYLSFSKLAYRLGVWHQKAAPRCLKLAIFAFGRLEKG